MNRILGRGNTNAAFEGEPGASGAPDPNKRQVTQTDGLVVSKIVCLAIVINN